MAFDGERGGVVYVTDGDEAQAIAMCIVEANKNLSKGIVFEVRARLNREDFKSVDRSQLAWYHLPDMIDLSDDLFCLGLDNAKNDRLGGYFIVLRSKSNGI